MISKSIKTLLVVGSAALALTACGDPNTSAKSDDKASEAADNKYRIESFKSGDAKDWKRALDERAKGQNDYVRARPL